MVFHLHYELASQLLNAEMITPIQLKNTLTSHLQKQKVKSINYYHDLQLQNMPLALQPNLLPLFHLSMSKAPSVLISSFQTCLPLAAVELWQ